jgi:TolB protein
VHVISDAVVEQVFEEAGMAATRVAFSMRSTSGGTKDLFVVDSDGENLRRVSRHDLSIISPSWHPEGERIAFLSFPLTGDPGIFEVDLRTVRERRIPRLGDGQITSVSYLPDGDRLAVSLDRGFSSRLMAWDAARGCCPTTLAESRSQDLSASFSPDGVWIAFTSNRLGPPLVFVQAMAGGPATLIAPYVLGQPAAFTAPEWSPRGGVVAYHGRLGRGQQYQILVTEFVDGRVGRTIRLTADGSNEAPSWAPDGRHLVFVGERAEGTGLYVLDTATGRTRRLATGRDSSTQPGPPRSSPEPGPTAPDRGPAWPGLPGSR